MAKKLTAWKTKGMNRDLSVSAFNPEFAFENINLRLSTNDGNTLLSWVNEKGTLLVKIKSSGDTGYLSGIPIGTAVLNHQLIIFTTTYHTKEKNENKYYKADFIYKLVFSDTDKTEMEMTVLYNGNLNFSTKNPLETLVSYEETSVQKVYWTDYRNQPRIINIAADDSTKSRWRSDESTICTAFDFVPELALEEDIWVEKTVGGGGMFAPGVIQYAFTYFNKYGQESNIFYTTPLLYVSYSDRGGSPEDKIDNTFKITISKVDKKFEYLRIYSIQRTSVDGIPICKRIQDISLKNLNSSTENSTTNRNIQVSSEPVEKDYASSTIDPIVYKDGGAAGPDIVEQSRMFLAEARTAWLGYRNDSFHDLRIVTDDSVVTFGSSATSESMLWISTNIVDYRGVRGFVIIETPSTEDDGLTEPLMQYEEPEPGPEQDEEPLITVSYTDTGLSGDSVDPTELLYKGGEQITALTMEQKDNTLFFGNIEVTRKQIVSGTIKTGTNSDITIQCSTRKANALTVSTGDYPYYNQLTATIQDSNKSTNCAGFKKGDYYRCGIQFQDKTGKWSDPVFVEDKQQDNHFSAASSLINIPIFEGKLNKAATERIKEFGYKRARAVVVYPNPNDRVVRCQGVVNPTVYTSEERTDFRSVYAQSSWFYRPSQSDNKFLLEDSSSITVSPTSSRNGSNVKLEYTSRFVGDNRDYGNYRGTAYNPDKIRQVEIEGEYDDKHKFTLDYYTLTLNSPEIEFDTNMAVTAMKDTKYKQVGYVGFTKTLSDIDIQTVTPTIHKSGSGFIRKASTKDRSFGIVSGLFYDDFLADENVNGRFAAYPCEKCSAKWLIYPWQRNGALNNDINRPEDQGVMSAELKKKIISNLRISDTSYNYEGNLTEPKGEPQIFSSEDNTILKIGSDGLYRGNVDTMISPDVADGKYFALDGYKVFGGLWADDNIAFTQVETPFTSKKWWKTLSLDPSGQNQNGIRVYVKEGGNSLWKWIGDFTEIGFSGDDIGDDFVDLVVSKVGVRMKYKSSSHVVFQENSQKISWSSSSFASSLPIVEILNNITEERKKSLFGGTSQDALRENIWIPCGEPIKLGYNAKGQKTSTGETIFEYSYGDTYYQRYDCLKTYAFTREDVNQVVEIGSFMLETHINIDGRYDRNRGQSNNLNMSPQNFNLINPVYSQLNNFFSYKIQDEDAYKNTSHKNLITWSKTKESGADVDLWTNVTLASVLEMDGDKGEVTSIRRFNNQLICFQDTGIARILYNDNVQIQSTQGVPIEIANSGKVQGKDYISNTIGCSNKWSIVNTPNGIYFLDSNDKSIYMLGGQGLQNLSQTGGFNSWAKNNIPASNIKWTPDDFDNFVTYYDKLNQDVLFINKNTALAYSEKLGVFTSFYDYGNTSYLCNLDDVGLWIKGNSIWKHQGNDIYCNFFGNQKPYSMILVGNPEPQLDKIFTNLEFRACVEDDGEFNQSTGKFTPTLPFDSLETWDEYQHGITTLENKNGHSAMVHGGNSSSLKRKFRIWRCDIPRDNYPVSPASEALQGISRFKAHPNDRMRNPWLYLKLLKEGNTQHKTEIHDLVMTYFE